MQPRRATSELSMQNISFGERGFAMVKSHFIRVWLTARRIATISERSAGTAERPQAQNIVRPVILYYPAEKASAVGTAMIVAPGGGFRTLMMSHEGVDVAKRLNQMGMDAFVLKYRTTYVDPNAPPGAAGRGPAAAGPQAGQNVREMLGADGQQAVRLLRQRAAEYGVLPNRIGFIGYSAGGV
jgi:acetyl esterase/lipase